MELGGVGLQCPRHFCGNNDGHKLNMMSPIAASNGQKQKHVLNYACLCVLPESSNFLYRLLLEKKLYYMG